MSGGRSCACPARADKKRWEVVQRQQNRSAFNGYHATSSDYSSIHCRACGRLWRSKAAYVRELPDARPDWINQRSYEFVYSGLKAVPAVKP